MSRHAGVLLPLFSAPSSRSWGIGELADVAPLARWLASGGFDRLLLLPLGTMADGQASPYSETSAMAIDPIFIAIGEVEDFAGAGGEAALSVPARDALAAARAAGRVRYGQVWRAKREALDLAFARFAEEEWANRTARAAACAAYLARERWWLDDWALFDALAAAGGRAWRRWPGPIAGREPAALDAARRELGREVLRRQYWQWIAESQWQAAREAARGHGVTVLGDLPFMVDADSADVWAHQGEFLPGVRAGAPPDSFSDTGQDWGLPTPDWAAAARTDFAWMRQRARRMAALYDGFRVDHVVGFFRTWARPASGEPFFTPAREDEQRRLGERILGLCLETGAAVVAEDLGTVPDFVRHALARLGVPGMKVLRWERAWNRPGQPFLDPASYPASSLAMTGTHDTETLAAWWDGAPLDERRAALRLPPVDRGRFDPRAPWSDRLRDALLDAVYRAGSDELILPVQDLFGWRDRINVPGTVDGANWTWRLPWPVDALDREPEAAAAAAAARARAAAAGRGR